MPQANAAALLILDQGLGASYGSHYEGLILANVANIQAPMLARVWRLTYEALSTIRPQFLKLNIRKAS